MEKITNVSYRLTKSSNPRYCEVVASFKYKGKRREYYIFVKKNDKYKPSTYLKVAQKQFAIDLKNGKVADAYMHKAPLIVLATAFAATAIVFGALIVKKYIPQQGEGITFDVGSNATLELYDEKQISFPIQSGGVSWDNFYKDHHYFGAVRDGYDFLYWSLDGKNPIDNNYVFTEPVKLVPVFHENTDGVSFILRHIPNEETFGPDELPMIDYEIQEKGAVENIKIRKNYSEWSTYDESSDIKFAKVGDVISFKVTKSYISHRFHFSDEAENGIFAVSGNIKTLINNEDYKEGNFASTFENTPIYSAGGLIIPGDELPAGCLDSLFQFCPRLAIPPRLPAHKVGENCYGNMFNTIVDPQSDTGDSNLLIAPELPATTLGNFCYARMFAGCTSLVKGPSILPAMTLENSCYYAMFYNCVNLTEMPVLPATITIYQCYRAMFLGCISLSVVHDLPATQCYEVDEEFVRTDKVKDVLAPLCYDEMFAGCISMQESPHIFANKLDSEDFGGQFTRMFIAAKSLRSIKIDYKGNFYYRAFGDWCDGVAEHGTFYYNGSDTTRGADAIPEGWTVKKF